MQQNQAGQQGERKEVGAHDRVLRESHEAGFHTIVMPEAPDSMYCQNALLLVVFFLFFRIVVFFVLVVVFFLFFVLVFIEVVGGGIQMHRMRLRDFQFRFTLWAAQDFALLDFVLIHIYFGATIGAANHGTILRTVLAQGL